MGTKGLDRAIDYIELNVAEIGRAKAFYGQVFGWTSPISGRPVPSSRTAG